MVEGRVCGFEYLIIIGSISIVAIGYYILHGKEGSDSPILDQDKTVEKAMLLGPIAKEQKDPQPSYSLIREEDIKEIKSSLNRFVLKTKKKNEKSVDDSEESSKTFRHNHSTKFIATKLSTSRLSSSLNRIFKRKKPSISVKKETKERKSKSRFKRVKIEFSEEISEPKKNLILSHLKFLKDYC